MSSAFGNALTSLRDNLELTNKQLAEKIGVHQSAVGNWMMGKRPSLSGYDIVCATFPDHSFPKPRNMNERASTIIGGSFVDGKLVKSEPFNPVIVTDPLHPKADVPARRKRKAPVKNSGVNYANVLAMVSMISDLGLPDKNTVEVINAITAKALGPS